MQDPSPIYQFPSISSSLAAMVDPDMKLPDFAGKPWFEAFLLRCTNNYGIKVKRIAGVGDFFDFDEPLMSKSNVAMAVPELKLPDAGEPPIVAAMDGLEEEVQSEVIEPLPLSPGYENFVKETEVLLGWNENSSESVRDLVSYEDYALAKSA